jgi:hypothetical protein
MRKRAAKNANRAAHSASNLVGSGMKNFFGLTRRSKSPRSPGYIAVYGTLQVFAIAA